MQRHEGSAGRSLAYREKTGTFRPAAPLGARHLVSQLH